MDSFDRRTFFRRCFASLGALGVGGFFYSAFRFSGGKPSSTRANSGSAGAFSPDFARENKGSSGLFAVKAPDGMYELEADAVPEGGSVIVALGTLPVTLVNNSGEFRVFDATCSHLGCLVKWDPSASMFLCPCHGGTYNADGKVLSGPPPGALMEHRVVEKEGMLRIAAE